MGRILIDTNAYTALLSGDAAVSRLLKKCEAVLFCTVVIGELLEGFISGNRERQNREILEGFRRKPRTVCVPITESTAEWYAVIKKQLKKKGRPIPVNDVWIAACCMEHGAALLTYDGHFADIDGLLVRAP